MLKKFSNGCVRIMNRWLPDPFLFAIILTIVVFIAACLGTQQSPWEMIWAWGGKGKGGDGMWGLLAFSMQMALVLVLGSALASAKVCKKILNSIAGLAKSKMSAIVVVTAVSPPSAAGSTGASASLWAPCWPKRSPAVSTTWTIPC